jgi:hypothetical protein
VAVVEGIEFDEYWSLEETTIQDLEAKVFSQVWHTGCTYVPKYDNLLPHQPVPF